MKKSSEKRLISLVGPGLNCSGLTKKDEVSDCSTYSLSNSDIIEIKASEPIPELKRTRREKMFTNEPFYRKIKPIKRPK